MIIYSSKDSFLEIPKGLGNFSTGGSADVEPLSGSVIELSATTVTLSGAVETLNESVDSQGDAIADLLLDSDALDTRVSGNTADIAALSGAVETNALGIQNLNNYTQNELAPAIGGIGADLATLSGQVETLSSATVTGLETAQNAANSANTLASSAYTLADSAYTRADEAYNLAESLTGDTGGTSVYVLNLMTQEERADLYAELAPYRWQEKYAAVSSGFPVQDYVFYYFAGEETSEGWNDGDRGFVPLQLTMIHPDDYGGALFFTGIVKSRQNNSKVLWVRYNVTSTGEVDKSTGVNNYDNPVGYFYINDDGSVPQSDNRYEFQDKGIIMIKCGDWNRGWVESLSFTDDYTVLHIKGKVQINGTEYAGYWKWEQNASEQWSTVSFTATA